MFFAKIPIIFHISLLSEKNRGFFATFFVRHHAH